MMQGDAYALPIEIRTADGPAKENTFADIEVIIGPFRRTLREGNLTYDPVRQVFLFPLTQRDTFSVCHGIKPGQVRVRTHDGQVFGTSLGSVDIMGSLSREVL